ncbi:MAG: efflux RND transporter periplasmic adaptor subunit, partial [Isosphaeraceae bacterium]
EQFENWTAPKTLRILESDVLRAQSTLDYQTSRVAQYEERLAFFKRQVDACSIRAPHDGFLVYYTYPEHPTYRIQEGTVVLKTQKLFYLPDLKRMEVSVELHESVVREVGPGMRARVEVEGIPGRLIEGRVDSIASLPSKHWFNDVRHFTAKITLDDVPEGLKPGMTASVELTTLPRPNALVVPSLALTFEDGKDVCYVAGVDGPSRREVKVGLANRDLIEVTEGLEEGESVVLDPARQFASDFRDANG